MLTERRIPLSETDADALNEALAQRLGTWREEWECARCGLVDAEEVYDGRPDGEESWHIRSGNCGELCSPVTVAPDYCGSLDAAVTALNALELHWMIRNTDVPGAHVWRRGGPGTATVVPINKTHTALATALVQAALSVLEGKEA